MWSPNGIFNSIRLQFKNVCEVRKSKTIPPPPSSPRLANLAVHMENEPVLPLLKKSIQNDFIVFLPYPLECGSHFPVDFKKKILNLTLWEKIFFFSFFISLRVCRIMQWSFLDFSFFKHKCCRQKFDLTLFNEDPRETVVPNTMQSSIIELMWFCSHLPGNYQCR